MRQIYKIFRVLSFLVIMFTLSCSQIPTEFAGSDISGYQDGMGQNVKFGGYGMALAIDKDGNLFVGDTENHIIRKVTIDGNVTTFAGNANSIIDGNDGELKTATFEQIADLKFDSKGNLFVADKNKIMKIGVDGNVTTFVGNRKKEIKDGIGTEASFDQLLSIFIDKIDNIYAIDNDEIRIISSKGEIKSFNLKSKIKQSEYHSGLRQILVDKAENIYLLIDIDANYIYKITNNGKVTKFPNSKVNDMSTWVYPSSMAFDEEENIYVLDFIQKSIYKISPDGNVVKEISKLKVWFPIFFDSKLKSNRNSMEIDNKGKILYISDTNRIYKVKL